MTNRDDPQASNRTPGDVWNDVRQGFLRSFAVVGATVVLTLVAVIVVGVASSFGVDPQWWWVADLVVSFLTGFGLCGIAEDADPHVTPGPRKRLWPRLSDGATILAVAGTFVLLIARSLVSSDGVGNALVSLALFVVGAVIYAIGWSWSARHVPLDADTTSLTSTP